MKIVKLKTNIILNFSKFLVTFPILIVLGVTTKVFQFYYLELVVLVITLTIILWFFRVPYKCNLQHMGATIKVRVNFNIFNYKFIKIAIDFEEKRYLIKTRTNLPVLEFEKDELPFKIELKLAITKLQMPELVLR